MTQIKPLDLNEEQAKGIANNLRALMKTHQLSESALARALDTSIMTIRRILSGETGDPRISTIKLIADYFKVSVDSLLGIIEQQPMTQQAHHFIPILNWEVLSSADSIQEIDLTEWKDWYPIVSMDKGPVQKHAFALESRPSMQPRFPLGTLFIINPDEPPRDGDLILIKMKAQQELSLRELVIDPPKWQLQPIVSGSELIFYQENQHMMVGVVVLSVLHTRR